MSTPESKKKTGSPQGSVVDSDSEELRHGLKLDRRTKFKRRFKAKVTRQRRPLMWAVAGAMGLAFVVLGPTPQDLLIQSKSVVMSVGRFVIKTVHSLQNSVVLSHKSSEPSSQLPSSFVAPQPNPAVQPSLVVQQQPTPRPAYVPLQNAPLPTPLHATGSPHEGAASLSSAQKIGEKGVTRSVAKRIAFKLRNLKNPRASEITVSTDAPQGTPIRIRISGETGDVLNKPSYFLSLQRIKKGSDPVLKLKGLGVPEGQLKISAQIGDLNVERGFFHGKKDQKFYKAKKKHLKMIAWIQQRDKKSLYYTAEKLSSYIESALALSSSSEVSAWRDLLNRWKADKRQFPQLIVRSLDRTRFEYAYPQFYEDFQELMKNYEDLVEDKMEGRKRDVAAETFEALKKSNNVFMSRLLYGGS